VSGEVSQTPLHLGNNQVSSVPSHPSQVPGGAALGAASKRKDPTQNSPLKLKLEKTNGIILVRKSPGEAEISSPSLIKNDGNDSFREVSGANCLSPDDPPPEPSNDQSDEGEEVLGSDEDEQEDPKDYCKGDQVISGVLLVVYELTIK